MYVLAGRLLAYLAILLQLQVLNKVWRYLFIYVLFNEDFWNLDKPVWRRVI